LPLRPARLGGRIRFVVGVDVEGVVDECVGLGVDRFGERVERGVEVVFDADVRVEHVHGCLLGGLDGVFFGGEGVALLRLVFV